jgi:hypothetical protein
MEFKDWMQNGKGTPPSFAKLKTAAKEVTTHPSKMVFDGSVRKPVSQNLDAEISPKLID